MGRGNVCTFGEYEGLYYVDRDNFSSEYKDSDGNIINDYDLRRLECEDSLYLFIEEMKAKFSSFIECDKMKWLY